MQSKRRQIKRTIASEFLDEESDAANMLQLNECLLLSAETAFEIHYVFYSILNIEARKAQQSISAIQN
jgi:hypothetical protein